MMKIHSVLTALILAFALTSFIAPRCYADGEPIVIFVGEFSCCSDEYGSPILHCPGQNPPAIPFLAEYDGSRSFIKFYFSRDLGTASFQVTDQSTGWFSKQKPRFLSGACECQLPGTPGVYTIQITCRDGRIYYGTFEIK